MLDSDLDSIPSPSALTANRRLPFNPFLVVQPKPPPHPPSSTGIPLTQGYRKFRMPEPLPKNPLPIDWSPTKKRKNEMYVEKGFAATVSRWLISASHAQRKKEGGWFRIVEEKVQKTMDGGGVLVRGIEEDGTLRHALVITAGYVNTYSRGAPNGTRVGSRLKYEYPWWEVDMDGTKYRVLIFWTITKEPK